MASARIKFIWGGARQQPGEWHLGLWGNYERDPGSRITGRAISVRGLLGWLGGLTLAGYLAAATVLFAWFERQPFNLISYEDTLLLPFRWQQVRELRGRMMIEDGLAQIRARQWAEGQMKLRVGLARAPHDLRARLALAQFYMAANRWPNAVDVLKADLDSGYPGRRYLASLFALARRGDDEGTIVEVCDCFLPGDKEEHGWLIEQKVQALIAGGRPAEALRAAEAEGGGASALLREGRAIALLDLHRPDEAAVYLENWRRSEGADERQVLRLLVRAYRDARQFEKMDASWEQFRALTPADPRTYVYGVVQKAIAGRTAAADAALDDYFLRFAGTPARMLLVTTALTEAKQPALVQRCVDEATLHGFREGRFKATLAEAQLSAGDWVATQRALDELKALTKNPGPGERLGLEWMERLLAVASRPDEAPQAALLELLQQRVMPLKIFQESAEVLWRAGRTEAARNVLQLALRAYPRSRRLTDLSDQVTAAAPAKPAARVVMGAQPDKAPVERAFFEAVEADAVGGRWTEVAAAVREVRLAKPGWLERREADVLEWQMRAAMHTGDALELMGAAKLFLDGANDRGIRVVELARELAAKGDRTNGEYLLTEVLRKMPDFPPAVRLRQEWHPPPGNEAAAKTTKKN